MNTDSQALESCLTRINVTSYCILSEMKLWREIKIMSELKGAYSRWLPLSVRKHSPETPSQLIPYSIHSFCWAVTFFYLLCHSAKKLSRSFFIPCHKDICAWRNSFSKYALISAPYRSKFIHTYSQSITMISADRLPYILLKFGKNLKYNQKK